jgi:hypothetical protein
VLRKDGSPFKRIGPPEGSSFWPAFEVWLAARRAGEGRGTVSEAKRREEPRVCDKHASRHADASCQANCFACGDCFLHEAAINEALVAALRALLAEPYGCPFCDCGKLRKRVDGREPFHADDCAYLIARAALSKAESR